MVREHVKFCAAELDYGLTIRFCSDSAQSLNLDGSGLRPPGVILTMMAASA